jgi:hypothetical protein
LFNVRQSILINPGSAGSANQIVTVIAETVFSFELFFKSKGFAQTIKVRLNLPRFEQQHFKLLESNVINLDEFT